MLLRYFISKTVIKNIIVVAVMSTCQKIGAATGRSPVGATKKISIVATGFFIVLKLTDNY